MSRAIRALLTLAILAISPIAVAQTRGARLSPQCVDLIKLKTGQMVRGAVMHQAPDGTLVVAVERGWLRKTYPELLAKLTRDEVRLQRRAWEDLRDRLGKELKTAPEESRLAIFLRMERKRVEELLSQRAPSEILQFVWFEAAKKRIARVALCTPERRHIAAWAWYDRLANVETRDADDLVRELKRKGDNASLSAPDFSDRFPPRLQDDREWSARMAVAKYAFGEPLDFQGTGDVLVRSGTSAEGTDLAPVIAKLFGQQVDSLLKDLLGSERPTAVSALTPDDRLKPAIHEADRLHADAFRATRVDLDLNARRTTVHSVFVVQTAGGGWETIWSDRETQDGSKQRAQSEEIISKDPQIKAALGTVKSLGLVTDDQFQEAIRFGAATMAAQKSVDARFFAFRDSLVKRLDGPPIWSRGN